MARPSIVRSDPLVDSPVINDGVVGHDQAYTPGCEWVALSVTTVGALLAAVQGSSLVIALPDVLTGLNSSFLTVMWVLLGYLLITTALVPVAGRPGHKGWRTNT